MTRLAILSDIHGNLPALEAVKAEIERERPDAVVVAGDVVNWGPFSREVLERIAALGWACIRGNNEYYLLDYGTPRAPTAWSGPDFPLMAWLGEQLAGAWRTRVACWPDTVTLRFPDAAPVRVVHGAPGNPWQGIYPDLADEDVAPMLVGIEEMVMIAGHTHLPMDRTVAGHRVLNPGSVGVPLLGRHEATWLLLESRDWEWHAELRTVPFAVQPVLDAFNRQGFVERCGAVGRLVYREFAEARVLLDPFVRWRNTHHPGETLSEDLLARFTDADLLDFTDDRYRVEM